MAIEILPPQLANQIAAGEVVERPASVIKELVENSLDAGASRVDIDIDKGGSKLIRIRDNGSGIAKDDLCLALARHATSKVKSLDDLDVVMSFGFRGEALASISSVSRLVLTSKTADQTEAWQAHAEGSEMAVKVQPAAHPVGTTIEVMDLFFNTPARRRFLKSDKTEFTHIDEWLKRIVLIRRDVHFTLKHNGKIVRNYRPANTQTQYIQRLGQVCNKAFAQTAVKINCDHTGLVLDGYLQSTHADIGNSEVQYFYVNGRLVRDRLVNHAVRQAFSGFNEGVSPSYVLMLSLDPQQVDVNVHPAKHEVRFHQSRYVHDFILQALQSALSQANAMAIDDGSSSVLTPEPFTPAANSEPAGNAPRASSVSTAQESFAPASFQIRGQTSQAQIREPVQRSYQTPLRSYDQGRDVAQPSAQSIEAYGQLLKTPSQQQESEKAHSSVDAMPAILDSRYWVIVKGDTLSLLSIDTVAKAVLKQEICAKLTQGLIGQPLLMPVSIAMDKDWAVTIESKALQLRQLGIELSTRLGQLIIKKVPPYLRDSQLANIIPELLQWLRFDTPTDQALAAWLAKSSKQGFIPALETWQRLAMLDDNIRSELFQEAQALPWQSWLKEQQLE